MAANTVNLDALIIRDDFQPDSVQAAGTLRQNISITDLDKGFFAGTLRKPDFQRETNHWTPPKIVDLIRAFIDGDLIPAVILWQRGGETFIIDGAHRLSALLAWILDDFGDRSTSIKFFGSNIPPEQEKIAERTRKLVNKEIGPYAKFKGLRDNPSNAAEKEQAIMSALGTNSIIVQWVPASDAATAEVSFFKINQAAQPIDPTERRILQSRTAPNAIAARCLVRGGTGHKYWTQFSEACQSEIVNIGAEIYDALFRPPLDEPITTVDLPVAGCGYNQLPFAFDLVNLCNDVVIPARENSKRIVRAEDEDPDGLRTIKFLKAVRRRIQLITTKSPGSLGLHPVIYFYAMSGKFLPNAFLATAEFAKKLDHRNKKNEFTEIRKDFEEYLFTNKVFISLTVTKLGSGNRSLGRISDLFWCIFEGFSLARSPNEISQSLFDNADFSHLVQSQSLPPRIERGKTGKMSGATKSAVFIREGYKSANRCAICGAAVHFKSSTVDHVQRRVDGGRADMSNGQITHPYCNTGFKN